MKFDNDCEIQDFIRISSTQFDEIEKKIINYHFLRH